MATEHVADAPSDWVVRRFFQNWGGGGPSEAFEWRLSQGYKPSELFKEAVENGKALVAGNLKVITSIPQVTDYSCIIIGAPTWEDEINILEITAKSVRQCNQGRNVFTEPHAEFIPITSSPTSLVNFVTVVPAWYKGYTSRNSSSPMAEYRGSVDINSSAYQKLGEILDDLKVPVVRDFVLKSV